MADQNTILTDGTTQQTTTTVPDNVLEALVGDGKTYKTAEDLAKGKLNADIHIKRLETEAAELREKLAKAKTVEDVLETIKASTAPENDNSGSGTTQTTAQSSGLSAEQLAKIVKEQITGHETEKQKVENRTKAENKLREIFGDKAKEVFANAATTQERRQSLLSLAEVDPESFIRIFHQPQQTGSTIDTGQNGRNTAHLDMNSGKIEPGTEAYYKELRKKEPKTYYSAAVQLEMQNAALRDPSKYFGRKT